MFPTAPTARCSDQPIAHAAPVEDPPFVASSELAAQAAGVAVERSCGADHRVFPNGPQQLLLAEDPLGLAGEVDEQVVLLRAQVEVPIVEGCGMGGGIDPQRADLEHSVVSRRGTS